MMFFSMEELCRAISKGKRSAAGKDGIGYEFYKHMGELTLDEMLALINNVWGEGKLPATWKEAIVVPILKPGKEASRPGSYRPIALTSVMCKIMERMVADRLAYRLEREGWFDQCQCGFRRGRSTMDGVVLLDAEIKKAMLNKEVVVAVFLDIEKAYDMLWKEGLVRKLYGAGVRGRILKWIYDFLQDRVIQVRVGKVLSKGTIVENGTPQGSVISPLLFNIMINDMFKDTGEGFGHSLFADDGVFWKRGRNLEFLFNKMQQELNRITEWGKRWGFKMAVDKSKYVVFGNRNVNNKVLSLYGQDLKRVKEFKFLGVHIDEKLTWKTHIDSLVSRCEKVINVMRSLSGSSWGAERRSLLMIYKAMIRSRLDYGAVCFGSAAKTLLKKLDVVQAKALRVCCGALRTTSVPALLVEAGEMPLEVRRTKLAMQYVTKLRGLQGQIPAKGVLEKVWEWTGGRVRKECFIYKVSREMGVLNVEEAQVAPIFYWTPSPWWLLPVPEVDLSVLEAKEARNPAYIEVVRRQLGGRWKGFLQAYTDGSLNHQTGKVGFGWVVPELKLARSCRVNEGVSIYTAELLAILAVIKWIGNGKKKCVIICSDSASVLTTIKGGNLGARPDLMVELLETLKELQKQGKEVGFMWVPAHVGIEGNEGADKMAKLALEREVDLEIKLGQLELRSRIRERMTKVWQDIWKGEKRGRHYYSIQSSVKGVEFEVGMGRKNEVIMTRMRLGHFGFAKELFLLGKHVDGMCGTCGVTESVKHVMLECRKYSQLRAKMNYKLLRIGMKVISLKNILNPDEKEGEVRRILIEFLKSAKLYEIR